MTDSPPFSLLFLLGLTSFVALCCAIVFALSGPLVAIIDTAVLLMLIAHAFKIRHVLGLSVPQFTVVEWGVIVVVCVMMNLVMITPRSPR